MKKIILATSVLIVSSVIPAQADSIQSPVGTSQSAWNASPTYQNFQCPTGTARGEGVDMNFTESRNDDYYFVKCEPIIIYVPTPTVLDTPTIVTVPSPSDTTTILTTLITTTTPTVTIPSVIDTTTAESNTTTSVALTTNYSDLLIYIKQLITYLMTLIANLK